MPTALSTTKRKFNKLLDSISNASSTSLVTHYDKHNGSTATLPSSMDPPSKKPRIARPSSVYEPRTAGFVPHDKATSIRPMSMASTQATLSSRVGTGQKPTPNYAPWDRDQFMERLKTFRHVDKWMAKPEAINEVEWARRGWSCVGRETVGCVGGCRKEVAIKLEDDPEEPNKDQSPTEKEQDDEDDENEEWREAAQKKLIEKYAEMIATAHASGCLWRRRGCDDTIQRLPLAHQANALEGLRTRYQSLLTMASELPPVLSTPDALDIPKLTNQATSIINSSKSTTSIEPSIANPSSSPQPTPPSEPLNSTALILALFGWQAEEDHIAGLATCPACFRRLGLWLFKSPDSAMDRLDVISEHRDYCPWINVLSQNGGSRRSSLDGLAGWEVLQRAVAAKAGQRAREQNEERMERGGGRGGDGEGEESEGVSVMGSAAETLGVVEEDDEAFKEEKDRERWARLKRLKQVFRVKKKGSAVPLVPGPGG